jgi:hypothetical protein
VSESVSNPVFYKCLTNFEDTGGRKRDFERFRTVAEGSEGGRKGDARGAAGYVSVVQGHLAQLPVGSTLIRDSHPKGYQSKKGQRAGRDYGIEVVRLPKRSPNIQPMEFAFHSQINRVLRGREKDWPPGMVEARALYTGRDPLYHIRAELGRFRLLSADLMWYSLTLVVLPVFS